MIRLAIVGSRCLAGNTVAERAVLDCILAWRDRAAPGQLTIVSGGVAGVDTMAERIADALDLPKRIFRPDAEALAAATSRTATWPVYRARNDEMAEFCTHLQCIRCPASATRGSWYTEEAARRLGRRVMASIEIGCGSATHAAVVGVRA